MRIWATTKYWAQVIANSLSSRGGGGASCPKYLPVCQSLSFGIQVGRNFSKGFSVEDVVGLFFFFCSPKVIYCHEFISAVGCLLCRHLYLQSVFYFPPSGPVFLLAHKASLAVPKTVLTFPFSRIGPALKWFLSTRRQPNPILFA